MAEDEDEDKDAVELRKKKMTSGRFILEIVFLSTIILPDHYCLSFSRSFYVTREKYFVMRQFFYLKTDEGMPKMFLPFPLKVFSRPETDSS